MAAGSWPFTCITTFDRRPLRELRHPCHLTELATSRNQMAPILPPRVVSCSLPTAVLLKQPTRFFVFTPISLVRRSDAREFGLLCCKGKELEPFFWPGCRLYQSLNTRHLIPSYNLSTIDPLTLIRTNSWGSYTSDRRNSLCFLSQGAWAADQAFRPSQGGFQAVGRQARSTRPSDLSTIKLAALPTYATHPQTQWLAQETMERSQERRLRRTAASMLGMRKRVHCWAASPPVEDLLPNDSGSI